MAYKAKDGRYKKNIYIGVDDKGRKKYKTVYGKTQKDLKEAEFAIRAKLHKNLNLTQSNTFSLWAEAYLTSLEGSLTPSEAELKRQRVKHLVDYFGDTPLSDIRLADIQLYINELAKTNPHTQKPSSKDTLNRHKRLLKNIFDYAIQNRVTDYNPAAAATVPKNSPQTTRRALDAQERRRIIEFEHYAKPAMMIMLFSGLRRGEVTALTWNDIDTDASTITVSKSYDLKNNCLKAPKNGKTRVVSIPRLLSDYLDSLPRDTDYVVTTRKGQRMTASAWKAMLESYLADANVRYAYGGESPTKNPMKAPMLIEPFTYHCLRHTFCTMMYEAGVDVLVAMEQMGHSNVKTTLDIYTHLSEQHKLKDISKLDSFVSDFAQSDAADS